jgi:hypothetical protein
MRAGSGGHTFAIDGGGSMIGRRTFVFLATLAAAGAVAMPASQGATANRRPIVHILSAKAGAVSVTMRFSVCDDSMRPVTMVERDIKYGQAGSVRHLWTVYPKPCGTYEHSWLVAPRFRGTFWVRVWAHDVQLVKSPADVIKVYRQ